MRGSIHKYFKVGLIAFMAYPTLLRGEDPNTLEHIKKIARDDYFDAIEMTWIKDDATRAKVAKLLETSHLRVCYGAQPRLLTTGMNANHFDEVERQKAEKILMEAIDEAHSIGSKGIAFLSGKWQAMPVSATFFKSRPHALVGETPNPQIHQLLPMDF